MGADERQQVSERMKRYWGSVKRRSPYSISRCPKLGRMSEYRPFTCHSSVRYSAKMEANGAIGATKRERR
jgi:hypothetical protein